MSYTGDPVNNPTDRIRLNVGDTDPFEESLSDNEYAYAISLNTNDEGDVNEGQASIQALKWLVAKYADYVTEKAGTLFIKESEKFYQYKALLESFTRDPSMMLLKSGEAYGSGISVSDMRQRYSDRDNNMSNIGELEDPVYNVPYRPYGFRDEL